MSRAPAIITFAAVFGCISCRDLSQFSTGDGARYEGTVASAAFVRSGFADGTSVCLSIDANHFQDAPGTISTSDGRFQKTTLRPIPQLLHDPLSTLSFGEGRVKNLVYVATPKFDVGDSSDVMVFISLLQDDGIEVRILRGAPGNVGDVPPRTTQLFGVFQLSRKDGACAY